MADAFSGCSSRSVTTITLQNFEIDPGIYAVVKGDVLANGQPIDGAQDVRLFALDTATLRTPVVASGVATLTGATMYLTNEGAQLLNTSFRTDALEGGGRTGTKIGTLIVRAAGS